MNMTKPITEEELFLRLFQELKDSQSRYESHFSNPNEAYGIIRKEYLELEAEFQKYKKDDPQPNMCIEALQVAAMCLKLCLSFWSEKELFTTPTCYGEFRKCGVCDYVVGCRGKTQAIERIIKIIG